MKIQFTTIYHSDLMSFTFCKFWFFFCGKSWLHFGWLCVFPTNFLFLTFIRHSDRIGLSLFICRLHRLSLTLHLDSWLVWKWTKISYFVPFRFIHVDCNASLLRNYRYFTFTNILESAILMIVPQKNLALYLNQSIKSFTILISLKYVLEMKSNNFWQKKKYQRHQIIIKNVRNYCCFNWLCFFGQKVFLTKCFSNRCSDKKVF